MMKWIIRGLVLKVGMNLFRKWMSKRQASPGR